MNPTELIATTYKKIIDHANKIPHILILFLFTSILFPYETDVINNSLSHYIVPFLNSDFFRNNIISVVTLLLAFFLISIIWDILDQVVHNNIPFHMVSNNSLLGSITSFLHYILSLIFILGLFFFQTYDFKKISLNSTAHLNFWQQYLLLSAGLAFIILFILQYLYIFISIFPYIWQSKLDWKYKLFWSLFFLIIIRFFFTSLIMSLIS